MVLKFLKGQEPLVFIILPIVMACFWIFSGFHYFTLAGDNGMPFYSILISLFKVWPAWTLVIFCYLLIASQCLHFNYILNKYEILGKPTFLPALIYFIFSAFLPQFLIFHPVLFVNSILLFVFEKVLSLYKNNAPLTIDFDTCFLLGLASLFYFPSVVFVLVFFIGLSILKPFSWRDWVVGMIGLLLPYFFVFVYYFLNDNLNLFIDMVSSTPIDTNLEIKNMVSKGYQVSLLILSFFVIAALLQLRKNFYKNDIKTRNFQQVVVVFFFTALACSLLTKENMLYKVGVLLIPFSILICHFLLTIKKNWIAESVLILLVATLAFNYFISF